ncbi:hypothetical protein FNV43_RR07380 [Rhamnella rubrinervis]|uniref:Uncharacterized protein n=1 Tax=Rhamnella rubrinervis TaxID=2594499 RepID=A0A8K0HF90_9ROSA|nr:hypothetical protein FNV43_RR07380 [Rhamnella rubrinervis]
MEAEEFMKLYDSGWFEINLFNKTPSSSNLRSFEADPDQKNQEEAPKFEISRMPSHHTRSMSDQLNTKTSFVSGSLSPDSVPLTPELHTILSGKEITEFGTPNRSHITEPAKKKSTNGRRRKGESKSLSDLEFEELKGFMDLGFVFSEEDRESSLASIIPGLQRLGKNKDGEEEEDFEESAISRPYLSEAWDLSDSWRKKSENPLMNWRIPALSNEVDMKDNLRWKMDSKVAKLFKYPETKDEQVHITVKIALLKFITSLEAKSIHMKLHMKFNIGGGISHFEKKEFELVSGLEMDSISKREETSLYNRINDDYFNNEDKIMNVMVNKVFTTTTNYLDDDDMVKLALLYLIEYDLIGKESHT